MVSPQDLKSSDNSKIPDLIHKIDNSILSNHGTFDDCEIAELNERVLPDLRNKIALKYIKAGWNYVYHKSVSKDGRDITAFIFSQNKMNHLIGYTLVSATKNHKYN